MKIIQVDTLRLREFPNVLWVEIRTDAGIVGLGETFLGARAVEAYLHETAAPYLLGRDPLRIEQHATALTGYVGYAGSGAETRGRSAVNIALWDILGQVTGQPLYQLLGGARDRIQAYALYIDPPLGRCGMTDAEIRKSGRRALATKYAMSRVSRAYEKGETRGFIKISVDAETKQILGAAILGTGGDEVIHVLLDVMYAKAPYTVIQRAMHIHPTVAEYLPTVLGKLEPFA